MTIGDGFDPHGDVPSMGKIELTKAGPVPIGAQVVRPDFATRYDVINEMAGKIRNVIDDYAGQVSMATALGVLRVIEHDLIRDHHDE